MKNKNYGTYLLQKSQITRLKKKGIDLAAYINIPYNPEEQAEIISLDNQVIATISFAEAYKI